MATDDIKLPTFEAMPAETECYPMERVSRDPRTRRTRAEKAEATRNAILQGAAIVVGKLGYGEASIANVTQQSKVALGTFYNYFQSKQDLFDQLLPWAGHNIHAFMDDAVRGVSSYAEYEVKNLQSIKQYLKKHRYFLRVLSEAEVMAPNAYEAHMKNSIKRYKEALLAAHARGELPNFGKEEMESVACMLVATKLALFMRYGSGAKGIPFEMEESYLKFVLHGVLEDRSNIIDEYLNRENEHEKAGAKRKRAAGVS